MSVYVCVCFSEWNQSMRNLSHLLAEILGVTFDLFD